MPRPRPEPFSDYLPPRDPSDDPVSALEAVPFAEVERRCGIPEVWRHGVFSEEAVALARAGRLLSGRHAPGEARGFAIFREGLHLGEHARILAFPAPLPRRSTVRLEVADLKRFFPF